MKKFICTAILLLYSFFTFSQSEKDWDKEYFGLENSYIDKGDKMFQNKKYFEAIKFFTKSIEINESNFYAYFLRGTSKSILEDNRGALIDLEKAEELLNLDKAANGKAVDTFNEILGVIYANKGVILIKLKDLNSGCLYLSKAGELGDAKAYDLIKQFCK